MKITGTFLDDITHDIPSANWGAFMSPNSMYPSAHNLYKRYQEWVSQEEPSGQ